MSSGRRAGKPEPKTASCKEPDIEFYIETAQRHGTDSEPDHEVGDLQDFLRAMWEILSPEQRVAYAQSHDVRATLAGAMPEYDPSECAAKQ